MFTFDLSSRVHDVFSPVLTKLGYLIDNPWSNAIDRAKSAGRVLADVLIERHLGVRPITLIGFSPGARVIFYALLELAKQKKFGIQDVFLLVATLSGVSEVIVRWFLGDMSMHSRGTIGCRITYSERLVAQWAQWLG